MTPGAVRRRLQIILERAGCKRIRFHDLRHTFATLSLESGMDVKTLSAMLGHVSAATTLDIYTHITSDMLSEAAAKIDRGLGNEVAEDSAKENPLTDFQPVMRRTRKPGTGCITEINDHLFAGSSLSLSDRTILRQVNIQRPRFRLSSGFRIDVARLVLNLVRLQSSRTLMAITMDRERSVTPIEDEASQLYLSSALTGFQVGQYGTEKAAPQCMRFYGLV